MTTEQAVKLIKEMLFGKTEKPSVEVKMMDAKLMDGTTVTNNLEGDLEIGQTLYVVAEDGTLVLAPASQEHQLEDGTIVVLDEASIVIEIKAAGVEEAPVEETPVGDVEEVVVEAAEETTEANFEDELNTIKLAVEKLLDIVQNQSQNFNELKSDFEAFKTSDETKPLNTKKETYSQSFSDYRLDMLKQLKNK